MKFVIFVSLLVVTGVRCIIQSDSFLREANTSGSACYSPIHGAKVQFLTPGIAYYGDGPFYNEKNDVLTYVDRKDIARFCVDFNNHGKLKITVKNFTEGMQLAFCMASDNANIHIVGAGNKLVVHDSEKSTEKTITLTMDTGYIISKGHADKAGRLFITMISQYDKRHKGGRLYRIDGQTPKLVKQYNRDVTDFVFNKENTKLFLVTSNGKHIARYNYNNETGDLSDEKIIFRKPPTFLKHEIITAIEINNENKIWATIYGGMLVKIDSSNGEVIFATQLPTNFPTGITFGGKKCSDLIITTSQKCCGRKYNAGGSLFVTGLRIAGCCDYPVNQKY